MTSTMMGSPRAYDRLARLPAGDNQEDTRSEKRNNRKGGVVLLAAIGGK
jgi:hypothetical protein